MGGDLKREGCLSAAGGTLQDVRAGREKAAEDAVEFDKAGDGAARSPGAPRLGCCLSVGHKTADQFTQLDGLRGRFFFAQRDVSFQRPGLSQSAKMPVRVAFAPLTINYYY